MTSSLFTSNANNYFTVNNEGKVGILVALQRQTVREKERRTNGPSVFLKSPHHADSNDIVHAVIT